MNKLLGLAVAVLIFAAGLFAGGWAHRREPAPAPAPRAPSAESPELARMAAELAALRSRLDPAPPAHADPAAVPPPPSAPLRAEPEPPSAEAVAAVESADRLIDESLARGVWSARSFDDLDRFLIRMPPGDREQALSRVTLAINDGQLKVQLAPKRGNGGSE